MTGRRWRRRDRPPPFERGWFRRANAAPRPGRCPSRPSERRARCRDRGVSRRDSREPPAAARSGLRRLHGRPSRWRPASEKTTLPRLHTWGPRGRESEGISRPPCGHRPRGTAKGRIPCGVSRTRLRRTVRRSAWTASRSPSRGAGTAKEADEESPNPKSSMLSLAPASSPYFLFKVLT